MHIWTSVILCNIQDIAEQDFLLLAPPFRSLIFTFSMAVQKTIAGQNSSFHFLSPAELLITNSNSLTEFTEWPEESQCFENNTEDSKNASQLCGHAKMSNILF